MRPVLQPGNSLRAVWRARLDEHLGTFAVEGLQLRAGSFLTFSHAVYAVTHLGAWRGCCRNAIRTKMSFIACRRSSDHVDDARV